ncbi:MAG: PEP-CTERM sorting domain-containing protein [Fimbriimonadaceae bacterium]|nr:PEP-CTERM sorting domain-containing protein [Chthonomonadaceae bacterium]MCO5295659.1 PEP-CTERM sorting domain-containing protein [Fimbriimonadaceae bacterium]
MNRTFRCALATLFVVAGTHAGFAQSLNVTQYATHGNGGVNIQADWDLGSSTWCDPANVRWIQNIKLKNLDGTDKNNVPGYINRPNFIDPLPDQPGGPWDTLPWYDVTYGSAADRNTNTNRIANGSGRFFNDSPAGWGPFGPMMFCAFTAVVCIDNTAKTASYMGGFSWGFTVAANGTVTAKPLLQMANNQATVDMFNTALHINTTDANYNPATFREWSMTLGDANCQLTYNPVPEPGTMALCAAAIGVAAKRRRRKVA